MIVSIDDIMMGDLVLVDGKPTKIDRKHYVQLFIKIEAIPLTSEILEKNGFKFNGLAYIGETFDLSEKFNEINNWNCGKFYHDCSGPGFTTFCTIKYVHELQHILKLQQNEKEIIL